MAVTMMVVLMANTLGSAATTIQMSRLSQELRASMQLMSRDLRRANFHSGFLNCFANINCRSDLDIDAYVDTIHYGVPRTQYQLVKSMAKIIENCDGLDEYSHGIYWVSGEQCRLDGTNIVGSPTRPVMLISAAQSTTFTGDNNIFGVLFVTDVEAPGATWSASGTNIVYSSAIIDADLDAFVGTFKIVYNADVSLLAAGFTGIGTLSGGWRDFGLPALDWEG